MPPWVRDSHRGRQRIEKLTMRKTSARRLSLHGSLPSIVFPVRNTGPAAASPDPRYETQRGRNADGEKGLQVVIHDNLQSVSIDAWRFGSEDLLTRLRARLIA